MHQRFAGVEQLVRSGNDREGGVCWYGTIMVRPGDDREGLVVMCYFVVESSFK